MIDKLCEEITRQLEVNNNEKSKTTRENNSHIKTINLDSRKVLLNFYLIHINRKVMPKLLKP